MKNMDFSEALLCIKDKQRVGRAGWNGKGMFIFFGAELDLRGEPRAATLHARCRHARVQYHGHIDMQTAQGYIVPWVASQADLLASDWDVVAPSE